MTGKRGSAPPAPTRSGPEEHVERLLDEALAATFPASDPVALTLGGYPPSLLSSCEPRLWQHSRDRVRGHSTPSTLPLPAFPGGGERRRC